MKGTQKKTILQGKVQGLRSRGKPPRQWMDDVKACTRLSERTGRPE